MKRLMLSHLAVASFVLSAAFAYADDPPRAPQTRPAIVNSEVNVLARLRAAASAVKLSDDQKKKLDTLLEQAGGDLKAAADKFKDDGSARAHEAQDIFDRLREQMRDVLTVEQRQELQRRFESLMGGSAGLLELLREQLQKLDLTDQQKKQIDQVMTDARAKFAELREQARAGSQEAREKILDLYSESRKKLESVLTPDQQRQLHENLAPRKDAASDK